MPHRIEILKDRAALLHAARQFFFKRQVLEVDCPVLSKDASIDAHIDLIQTNDGQFLHSSPEYGMKQLLSEGIGDIYQISHVFRHEESGEKHNPEFMMAEWYRCGFSFDEIINETLDFIRLFVGNVAMMCMTYYEAFETFAKINIRGMSVDKLVAFCEKKNIALYPGIENEGVDALLNVILSEIIEPQLGDDCLFVLSHYPASQAALARKMLDTEGMEVAERFEVYYQGIELANGYHELADAVEQRERLVEANKERVRLGKEALPIDENFLKALEKGLPDCCGVAVGVDRLLMLRHGVNDLRSVMN